MSGTADKIAHLRKTALEHPEYIDLHLPFQEIFTYVDGKEAATGIRFAVPEGNGDERVRGGLSLLSPEALSVDRDAATAVSYTHLRAHETRHDLVCRLL